MLFKSVNWSINRSHNQVLKETICVSLYATAWMKGKNSTLLPTVKINQSINRWVDYTGVQELILVTKSLLIFLVTFVAEDLHTSLPLSHVSSVSKKMKSLIDQILRVKNKTSEPDVIFPNDWKNILALLSLKVFSRKKNSLFFLQIVKIITNKVNPKKYTFGNLKLGKRRKEGREKKRALKIR